MVHMMWGRIIPAARGCNPLELFMPGGLRSLAPGAHTIPVRTGLIETVWERMNYGLVALAAAVVLVGTMLWDVQASALPDLPPSPPPDPLTMRVEVMQLQQDALPRDAAYMEP